MLQQSEKNKNITGITINKNEFKISQYADDTIIILDGSETSLVTALETIENSGLRLNSKKTEALWFGFKAGEETRLCPKKQFKWIQNKVKTLGAWLSTNPEVTHTVNYEEKIEKNKKHSEHMGTSQTNTLWKNHCS